MSVVVGIPATASWHVSASNPVNGVAHLIIEGKNRPLCGVKISAGIISTTAKKCVKCREEQTRLAIP